jgi:hypothetical protein
MKTTSRSFVFTLWFSLSPRGWRRRCHRTCSTRGRRRCRRHGPPPARALRNVRIIAAGAIAIIPSLSLRLGLHDRWWWWLNDYPGRNIRIGIGIYRSRVEIPPPGHNPPPAEPAPVPPMHPAAAAPPSKVGVVKNPDVPVLKVGIVKTPDDVPVPTMLRSGYARDSKKHR